MFDDTCPLCNNPAKASSWVRLILNNHRTAIACAEFFKTTPEQVNKHIYSHYDVADTVSPNDPEFIKDKLLKLLSTIELWFDEAIIDNAIDRGTVDLALKMSREIRDTLKLYGELNGQLSQQNATINIVAIQNNYRQLTNTLMMDLCPDCQIKVMRVIENKRLAETSI